MVVVSSMYILGSGFSVFSVLFFGCSGFYVDYVCFQAIGGPFVSLLCVFYFFLGTSITWWIIKNKSHIFSVRACVFLPCFHLCVMRT